MRRSANFGIAAITLLVTSVLVTGCGGAQNMSSNQYSSPGSNPPPTSYGSPTARPSMSTGRKVAWLVGSAALYYMLQKNKEQRQQGQATPQYYLSSNGRVYYRDNSGQVHWVTPPPNGIQVPQSEAQAYNLNRYQGFDGQQGGRTLAGSNSQSY